jgi:hypothetical protein
MIYLNTTLCAWNKQEWCWLMKSEAFSTSTFLLTGVAGTRIPGHLYYCFLIQMC